MTGKGSHILLEIPEPRILLSAEGLLNAIMPYEGDDILLDGMEQVVQYAELLGQHKHIIRSPNLLRYDANRNGVCPRPRATA